MKLPRIIGIPSKGSMTSYSHGNSHFLCLITNTPIQSTQGPIAISTLIILIENITVKDTVSTEVSSTTADKEAPIIDLTVVAICLVDSVHFLVSIYCLLLTPFQLYFNFAF